MTMVCPVCKRGNGAWIGCYNAACTDGRNLISVPPATAELTEARAEIERLTKERDEARAQVAAAFEAAARRTESGDVEYPSGTIDMEGEELREILRALTPADAQSALEAYGREKMREGRHLGADIALQYDTGEGAHDAILAAMEKEGGE